MKKKFLLLMVLLLCIGCTRINNNNYDVIVNDVIENSNNIYNTNSLGYKYYLPFSINKVYDKDYNQIFKVNDTYMYLYVDVISYYYKNNLNYLLIYHNHQLKLLHLIFPHEHLKSH